MRVVQGAFGILLVSVGILGMLEVLPVAEAYWQMWWIVGMVYIGLSWR